MSAATEHPIPEGDFAAALADCDAALADCDAALADCDAALTYPENLGVGRPNQPEHAAVPCGRGQALVALGRHEDALDAWKDGAAGAEGSPEKTEYRRLCAEQLASDK